MGYEEDVERLYREAKEVRAAIEDLWLDAQLTDVELKGAVSAAQIDDLSDSERDFAVSFGVENAKKWHTLSELSTKLGDILETIEQLKRNRK